VGPGADSWRGCVGPGADSRRGRVRPGVDAWDRARTLRASATAGVNPSGAIAGEWARAGRTGREHSVFARTEGNLRAAIAMGTRVWARTGPISGAGPNRRVLQGRRAHAAAEGAHMATGVGGIN
jgi:hypothetical protein